MFLDRVIHFGETLGDQVNDRSPKKLESLIEVPNVVHVKVHVLSYNMILIELSISVGIWEIRLRVVHQTNYNCSYRLHVLLT